MTTTSKPTESFARRRLLQFEGVLNKIFGSDLNPFYHLGALGFFLFWVIVVSGAYLYAFYRTGIELSYPSVEYLTNEQWYFGGIMRSLHRYASDALVFVMMLHLLRELILGRYRGPRWFAWITGVLLIWLIYVAGINGYMMPWDRLAQFAIVGTVEWLDWLPVFGAPMSQSFVSQDALNNRFFTLISFFHTTSPLYVLFFLWIHIVRVSYPAVNPPRALAAGILLTMLVMALLMPAVSQGPADLGTEPRNLGIDWFYLFFLPLLDLSSPRAVWFLTIGLTVFLAVLPWLPTRNKQMPIADVSLENCNGCGRCVADCPYEAVVLQPRTDGMRLMEQAFVVPGRCVSCGICAGACPSSTPFRSDTGYVSGIEMPSMPMAALRAAMTTDLAALKGDARVIVFGCDNAADVEKLRSEGVAIMSLPCTAMLPPSFIEYALHEHRADGVFITGCRENDCYNRLGGEWVTKRLIRKREPRLRGRVDRERNRIRLFWASSVDSHALNQELESFRVSLRRLNEAKGSSANNG